MSRENEGFFSQLLGNAALPKRVENIVSLPLESLVSGIGQPRRHFEETALAELAASIKERGVLQPILVRPLQNGRFEIVAGERRCRAAKLVGRYEVPAVIREFNDQEARMVALLENLQREDLNPVEETEAILELLALRLNVSKPEAFKALERAKNELIRDSEARPEGLQVIEEVFQGVGRNWQSFLRNQARLLSLPDDLYELVREGRLDYTKALVLARVESADSRSSLLERVITEGLSVRQIREEVNKLQTNDPPVTPRARATERYKRLGTLLKRSAALEDRKRSDQVLKLLDELERLLN